MFGQNQTHWMFTFNIAVSVFLIFITVSFSLFVIGCNITTKYFFFATLSNSLSELIKKKIDINFNVDKNLIGGLKIKVDDTLYDSSLQTKLENAKSKLVGV